ncbi:non-specific lipid-transfer protein [Verticillium dahliae VdLs.17]|uniref:propanoyl-CoA C-acyltransferase n=1 Tax=Verticillium dahliae (strain VdLs.17 / ATCC MYA-4575 / FGSC 10137) TaxID=498257 RepID=G2XBL2_VERDV|nr:non-specific lipid-transfer protein [Verticillium dahliae VdLs.17]EGY16380.1 non-specific lipid-transfer protein [Verticillium dahliae VdLs.17]
MAPKPKAPSYVLGVGMTKFIKPRGKVDYTELGFEAGVKAMLDAQINYDDVEQGVACYCYGDSTCGQRVFYQFGMTQIPIYNVNNNCSTGSTGLAMARQFVSSGAADCVLVVGFEKMMPGSLQSFFNDRENPTGTTVKMMAETRGITKAPGAAQMFGNAGREYMEKHGAEARDFAEIARVNHEHSTRNPYSQFQDVYTLDQILDAPMIHAPLTKLQCCPTSDGAAAAVVVSQAFLDARPHLKSQAVLIAGQCMATDAPSLFSRSAIDLMGFEMTQHAVRVAAAEAGIDVARDVQVVELHDCFSANELIVLDALGLAKPGKAHELVRAGDITYGGRYIVNPSGGLISKGHPLGATGHRPVRRARLAPARLGQQPRRQGHARRAAAQPRPRRCRRCNRLQESRRRRGPRRRRQGRWQGQRPRLQPSRRGEGVHQGGSQEGQEQNGEQRLGAAGHAGQG